MIKKSIVKCGLVFAAFIFTVKVSGHYELPIFTWYSPHSILNYVLVSDFLFSCLPFPIESFAFVLVEYQNEKDCPALKRYTPNIMRDFPLAKQYRCIKYPLLKVYYEKKNMSYHFFKK